MGNKRREVDAVEEYRREAEMSSFTAGWSRRFRGWHWSLRGRILLYALALGAAAGAALWVVFEVLSRVAGAS